MDLCVLFGVCLPLVFNHIYFRSLTCSATFSIVSERYLLKLFLLRLNSDFGLDFPFFEKLIQMFSKFLEFFFFVSRRLLPFPPHHDFQKYIPVKWLRQSFGPPFFYQAEHGGNLAYWLLDMGPSPHGKQGKRPPPPTSLVTN